LIKNDQLSFEMLALVDCFYKEEYENDEEVRKMWYMFCYHLLPRINKDWKHCLEGSRVYTQTFLYEKITTSDEAMTLWFVQNIGPKLKSLCENNWNETAHQKKQQRGVKQGEQELKAGLKDYIALHNLISAFKDKDNGIVANRWNDIFWEELVKHNPNLAKKRNDKDQNKASINKSTEEASGDVIVLPGIDCKKKNQNINLINVYNMRKSLKGYNNNFLLSKENDSNNETGTQNENIENGSSVFNADEVKNKTGV
jgi:hypothetical protein